MAKLDTTEDAEEDEDEDNEMDTSSGKRQIWWCAHVHRYDVCKKKILIF